MNEQFQAEMMFLFALYALFAFNEIKSFTVTW